jgi:hypothetical protein
VIPGPTRQRWAPAAIGAVLLSLAIFLFYFAPYPIRHARVPAGFDPPWYMWRATFAGSAGLGPVGTASRPGHAVLSTLLGAVTGRSQLELFVLFAQLLPAMLAVGVGALAINLTGRTWGLWLVTAALGGAVLGSTRLVGENVANLLTAALEVAALVVLLNAAGRRLALWGSVALLVAAGLSHWVFLAIFELGLAAAVALSVLAAGRVGEPRSSVIRQEGRFLMVVGLWTAAILSFLSLAVLRAPFQTFEIYLSPQEFALKLITDVARLWPATIAAAVGVLALIAMRKDPPGSAQAARRSLSGRLLLGWTVACAAGVLFGLATLGIHRFSLPPHRFLGLLAAVPGVVAAGVGVWWTGSRVGWRAAGAGVVVAAILLLAIPSVLRWYRYPILMRPEALRQAETAARYIERLPPGQPFVFEVDSRGPAVVYDTLLRERVIRMTLPPDRQKDLHLFVGNPSDLLAGRRTHDTPLRDRINESFWTDVAPILPLHPPVLVLRAMGETEFSKAVSMGAPVIGPGVALLQGTPPDRTLTEGSLPDGVPGIPVALLWAFLLLVLVAAAGVGWTALILGRAPDAYVFVSLAPLIGTGALLLGAFVATELGVRLHGAGGVATYIVVALAGTVSGVRTVRRGRIPAPISPTP